MNEKEKIIVIGGGAAGFFSAITAKHFHPTKEVILLEKSNKLLSKVKISGGGRCNVTNYCLDNKELSKGYPRGQRFLNKAFYQFAVKHTIQWFNERGVTLVNSSDNRMFPDTDYSQTIVNCLLKEALDQSIDIQQQTNVKTIEMVGDKFYLNTSKGEFVANKIIIAVGGIPKYSSMKWLEDLGCKVIPPVPSLFSFNMPKHPITELMGITIEHVRGKIEGEKIQTDGPLLITHWGMSGPAILKLSAWEARSLAKKNYEFNVIISWIPQLKEEEIRERLSTFGTSANQLKKVATINPFGFPKRFWQYFCRKIGLGEDLIWKELGKKNGNRLVDGLRHDIYPVKGKTTFKEEFVTAGGVDLSQINVNTMEHKDIPGLFFAGEILDIDGITGGYNFQAAWTTGYIAGKNV